MWLAVRVSTPNDASNDRSGVLAIATDFTRQQQTFNSCCLVAVLFEIQEDLSFVPSVTRLRVPHVASISRAKINTTGKPARLQYVADRGPPPLFASA